MHDDRKLIEARIDRYLRERLPLAIYPQTAALEVARWDVPGEPVTPSKALAAEYTRAQLGDAWGPPWGTTWFRLSGEVPAAWAGKRVELVVDLGFDRKQAGFQCEGLFFGSDGLPIKGVHSRSPHLPLPDQGPILFYLEAAANPLFARDIPLYPTNLGNLRAEGTDRRPLYRLARAELCVFERDAWEFRQDAEVLDELMRELPEDSARRWEILRALDRAISAPSFAEARDRLKGALSKPAHASAHRITGVGHAHIDSAWLWPVRETVRKVARTLSNVAALSDEHSDFVFALSQAQHAAWMKERYPSVFARLQEKVGTGAVVPVGGMWVESDTNLTGAEALVRQFVHGKRFFSDEFGVETDVVWLPDCFGYSAALPQIIALSQSRYFLTQKISWNQTNTFPHHTFFWEGLDGTRVFTHFPPADTYNAELSGEELARAARQYREKGSARDSLVPFGYGDGGGGPTREMLARQKRLADLEGSPRVLLESPTAFFRRAEAEHENIPVWAGELYLELHRGTYTTQARTKRGNRRCEHLFREAELWSAAAQVRVGLPYPYDALDRLWKELLLHQFHDILPGCSIAWVHRETEAAHAAIASELSTLVDAAQRALAGAPSKNRIVFNATPHAWGGIPPMGASEEANVVSMLMSSASVENPKTAGMPGGSAFSGGVKIMSMPTTSACPEGVLLEDARLAVRLDAAGVVVSIVDREAGREIVPPGGRANLLQLHPDVPNMWDAWDVDPFYRQTVSDVTSVESMTTHERGIRITRRHGESTFTQTLRLQDGTLVCDTEIDWQEREKFLKLAFDIDVHAHTAKAEIQFGHVERATHENTSWDAARFEVSAHRWVHVGEPGYGVALINDATYGHDMRRYAKRDGGTFTTVRASLLRAPCFPDPETDRGAHRFRHVLVPGATVADAIVHGYRVNLPPRVVPGDRPVTPLVRVDHSAVVIEAVKFADDRSGDLVVRLYESQGGRANACLVADLPISRAYSTDLLERAYAGTTHYGLDPLEIALRPFQIMTLRLERNPK